MSILEAISPENPIGESYKDEDAYIEVEVEIEKHFNVTNEAKVDWGFIIKQSEMILNTYSKDLKLASYWLYAQWQLNGWSAFLEAFEEYTQYLEAYDKALYPSAGRRKIKIFEWFENVIEKSLLSQLEQFSEEALAQLVDILKRLESVVPLTIEDEYRFLKETSEKASSLVDRLAYQKEEQNRQQALDQESNAKRQEEDAKLQAQNNQRRSEEEEILAKFTPSSNRGQSSLSTENITAIEHEDMEEAKETILLLCTKLFEKSASDYLSFKMLFSLGETLLEEAMHNREIERDDFMPSEDIATAVRGLIDSEVSFSQLLALEEQLLLRPTWMEGYYIATKMLFKLGQTKDAQRLESLIVHTIERLPELLEYATKNGELIPEKMQMWVEKKRLDLADDEGSNIVYQQAYQEVTAMRREQNDKNALALLEEYYRKSIGDEERFRWRLLFVDFSFDTGDKRLALALLLALEKEIEAYQLDKWQPELAIRTYETLLKPILTQELGSDAKERIYKKLSILDIQKVIHL